MFQLFTGHSLWEYITVFFDNIPKIIYFIYTAIASCLDLLQCLMRKLAGLDTYWINGVKYTQQDPVLEFILGMLGLGQNAGIYSALSTVFWSIAIFGLIVLVIATMVAIIKSHYDEDTNKTNPLSYVYRAIKAIFTFAIVPVAVILGIYLSQFLLQTADNITAGKSDAETVRGIYGDRYSTLLVDQGDGNYGRYDYFGAGSKATTTTISGMLFRTAAYDANRIRYGDYSIQGMIEDNHSANKLFGDVNAPMKGQASDQDWIAYQIDYAFMNNLDYGGDNGVIWAEQLFADGYGVDNALITIAGADFFRFLGVSDGFSKYNVGLVWYYYYLWKFNFFIGFASIAIAFGILTSIIVGLMSRLIYSAALFLIYPGTLGLAPLDEWNAFKKWRQQFISQLLMAFGSIIGMNIIFLILPYVNEIDWFGSSTLGVWGSGLLNLPSAIINTLITITGLLLIKEFITFISGLIGSTSAAETGDNTKKGMAPIFASAGKAALGVGNIAWKAGIAGLRRQHKLRDARNAANDVNALGTESHLKSIIATQQDAKDAAISGLIGGSGAHLASGSVADFDARVAARATRLGITDPGELSKLRAEMAEEYLDEHGDNAYRGYDSAIATAQQNLTTRQALIERHHLGTDDAGQAIVDKGTKKQVGDEIGREIAGAFVKFAKEGMTEIAHVNLKAIAGVFHAANNNKYDEKGNVAGSYTREGPSNKKWRSDHAGIADGTSPLDPAVGDIAATRIGKALGRTFTAPLMGVASVFASVGRSVREMPDHMSAAMRNRLTAPATPPKPTSSEDKISHAADAILKAAEKLERAGRR